MKHTQVEWSVEEIENKKNRFSIDHEGYQVAEVIGATNANLIASAPEMLEMLKYTLKYFQENTDIEGLQMYENLIAKAEGTE